MSKTAFSKSELSNIRDVLLREEMIPCQKISINWDPYNSGKFQYYIIRFLKDNKQLDVGFITHNMVKEHKLKEQLYEYFGRQQK